MTLIAGVDQLRLSFAGSKSLLFKDVQFSLHQGEKVLLLGPSGCGKSTLLQVLTGLIPHSVDVPMKAANITVPDAWGYVFQDPDTQFCMPYVDEEIAFVLENLQVPQEQMTERIYYYLNKVGLQLPSIHTNILELSQGMKQRLAIAAVLALEPEVLFLDEPTALLDPEGTKQVWDTIKQISEDKTLVIVEHKIPEIIHFVDRVVLFNTQGEIIADGEPSFIFEEYKKNLINDGIWYPGVWDDYIERCKIASHKTKQTNLSINKSTQPLIELNEFEGIYGKKTKISVTKQHIQAGEWISVVGKNGAGKSTLLLALMQLIKTTGHYVIQGNAVDTVDRLTDELAFVFQNPEIQFVTNSVYDEIAYSLRQDGVGENEVEATTNKLLSLFHLLEHQAAHPYHLSMGQKRRLSVASAMVKEQKVLLLDEPTFGQDAKNTFAILEKLEAWRQQGTTIIMVTHDLDGLRHFSTRVWEIDNGQLISDKVTSEYVAEIDVIQQQQGEVTCV